MSKIPREFAEFFFNCEYNSVPSELVVVDQRTRFRGGIVDGTRLISDLPEYNGSLGAHIVGWLNDEHPRYSPEGVFAQLYLDRLSDDDNILDALREFSKIDGCGWATSMMRALESLRKERLTS